MSQYPHKCAKCGEPAYVGFTDVDCSNGQCPDPPLAPPVTVQDMYSALKSYYATSATSGWTLGYTFGPFASPPSAASPSLTGSPLRNPDWPRVGRVWDNGAYDFEVIACDDQTERADLRNLFTGDVSQQIPYADLLSAMKHSCKWKN
jgi:hypothetical protein